MFEKISKWNLYANTLKWEIRRIIRKIIKNIGICWKKRWNKKDKKYKNIKIYCKVYKYKIIYIKYITKYKNIKYIITYIINI